MTLDSLAFIKDTFCAVSSVNKLYNLDLMIGNSSMNRNNPMRYTRKLIKYCGILANICARLSIVIFSLTVLFKAVKLSSTLADTCLICSGDKSLAYCLNACAQFALILFTC